MPPVGLEPTLTPITRLRFRRALRYGEKNLNLFYNRRNGKGKESNINLIHIDVSKQSKVNPNTSNEYLKEICNIIESNRLLRT